ncbi:DUF4198 domain-containing protein [Persephonella sp.]
MVRALIVLFFVAFTFSHAHELWITEKGGFQVLHYGHKGEDEIPYTKDSIKTVLCIKDGKITDAQIKSYTPLKIKSNCDAVFVEFSTGYWTKTPSGSVNKPKNEVSSPIFSWLSVENLLRINRWDSSILKHRFDGLVIIPRKDISALKKGDKVRLKVLFNGKPVSNVPVSYEGKVRGTTDSDGNINIRIKHNGLQSIEASYRIKVGSKKADAVIYSATLNFEVK